MLLCKHRITDENEKVTVVSLVGEEPEFFGKFLVGLAVVGRIRTGLASGSCGCDSVICAVTAGLVK